jgi:hypothetical protein
MFGGFARDIYSDMRVLDRTENRWTLIDTKQPRCELPHARFCHTMVNYKDKLAVFGGGGSYLKSIQMRLCLSDLHIFDIGRNKWEEVQGQGGLSARSRMNHSSALLGCLMLIQGGYTSENKSTLGEFNLFDMESRKWIECIHNTDMCSR